MKTITKKLFLAGLNCAKQMYIMSEIMDERKDTPQHIIEYKKAVCNLLYPEAIELKGNQFVFDSDNKKAQAYVNATIFLKDHNLKVTVDAIEITDNNEYIISILKPATKLKDTDYFTSAFVYFLLDKLKLKSIKVRLIYVNSDYIRESENTKEFIKFEDVTMLCKRLQMKIFRKVSHFQNVLEMSQAPKVDVGIQCLKPEQCIFKNQCWNLPVNNVFELRSAHTKTKLNLYYKDIVSFDDIAISNHKFTDSQMTQVSAALSNKIVFQKQEIKEWFKPIHKFKQILFLDFETFAPIIPICDGYGPFQRIPFQYSLDIYDQSTELLDNHSFLGDPVIMIDSRKMFIEDLINQLKKLDNDAPIIVYNKAFESSVLKELGIAFPDLEIQINAIRQRLYDLMEIFRQMLYYDPRFKGSYSIKAILPVLVPRLSYDTLLINNGELASDSYLRISLMNKDKQSEVREALLEYCKLDTLAMVEIYKYLKELVFNKKNKKTQLQ